MKLIGNIIWLIFGGFFSAVGWLLLGLFWCITVVGIPFGLQCFKFAALSLVPFGSNVVTNFEKHPIANIIWLVFGGFTIVVSELISGILLCITIIGIPFGRQHFKLAKLAIMPFGAIIN
ncbi:MAG: YccF domain-containing protein [Defluviitaleaceae bacterium]|nr:YccF domain-containing protein [Defluviitaleaceae bacterium]